MKMFEVNHHATMRKNLTNNILKLNTPGKEILHKRSVMSSIIDIPGTYLCSKPDDKIIKVGLNTSDNFVVEKLQCQLIEKELTKTGLVQNTTVKIQFKY